MMYLYSERDNVALGHDCHEECENKKVPSEEPVPVIFH